MAQLSNRDVFEPVIRKTQELSRQFEISCLQPFYQKVADVIRSVDNESAIFLETSYFSNMGMKSAVQPIKTSHGIIDPQQVYAPHGYDLLVDTDLYNMASNNRVGYIFETHKKVQEHLGIPMLIGEWGCFVDCSKSQLRQAKYISNLFEQYLASDTYFNFDHIRGNKIIEVIQRAYPMCVAGTIQSYRYDYKSQLFYVIFQAECTEGRSSLFYIPQFSDTSTVEIFPPEGTYFVHKIEKSNAVMLEVIVEREAEYSLCVRS